MARSNVRDVPEWIFGLMRRSTALDAGLDDPAISQLSDLTIAAIRNPQILGTLRLDIARPATPRGAGLASGGTLTRLGG